MKHWYIYNKKADFQEIAKQFSISPMLARILRNRDLVTGQEIRTYLYGGLSDLHDPFLLDGAEDACMMIEQAVSAGEKIRIVGDYDIDGICAGYILKTAIRCFGGDVDVAIPDRVEDGYGINIRMVEQADRDGIRLLITCDNGIRAFAPALKAKELGLRMIITDHHEAADDLLPEADVVIDPHRKDSHYPYPDLCGAAVAFKLMQALYLRNTSGVLFNTKEDDGTIAVSERWGSTTVLFDELLMFAGFATIGDVVPLQGENRIIAKEGIRRLRQTVNPGMNALINEKQLEKSTLDAYHIGFVLGPCVNSAGRLKDAALALSLFEAADPADAAFLAQELDLLNEERKQLTEQQTILARRHFDDRLRQKGELEKVLGVFLPDAHESIAGIIAGRLKEAYYRPAFVVTETENGLKGSGRSIEPYNMILEIAKLEAFFEKFGGHSMACGFTLKNGKFHDFMDAVNASCTLTENDLLQKTWIDMHLPVEYLSEEFVNELELLKPFGQANKKPLFADKNLKVNRYMLLGQNKNALKIFLESKSGFKIDGIMFGSTEIMQKRLDELEQMERDTAGSLYIACLYYPQINEFRGMRNLQLVISDFDVSR